MWLVKAGLAKAVFGILAVGLLASLGTTNAGTLGNVSQFPDLCFDFTPPPQLLCPLDFPGGIAQAASAQGRPGFIALATLAQTEAGRTTSDYGDVPAPPSTSAVATCHLDATLEWLGESVSFEAGATDPGDPDGVPNVRDGTGDLDRYDDGVRFFSHTPLFSVGDGPTADQIVSELNQGRISDELRDAFRDNGFPLLEEASVARPGTLWWLGTGDWLVTNGEEEFLIRWEGQALNIYPAKFLGSPGIVEITVRVSDGDSTRYRRDDDRDGKDDEDPPDGVDNDGDGRVDEDPPDPTLYLNGWIDWNDDGDWDDTGEQVVAGVQIWKRWNPETESWEWAFSDAAITGIVDQEEDRVTLRARFPVPSDIPRQLWARFRLDYGENVGPTGQARFGEVEDYLIAPDFGDAPDPPFPTLAAHHGPYHLNCGLEWLGDDVSVEFDAVDASDPDGPPNIWDMDMYDDGVTFIPMFSAWPYPPGREGVLRFTVWVADASGGRYADDPARSIWVNGWIDWNSDGDWEDPEEHVVPGARIWPTVEEGVVTGWNFEGGNVTGIVDWGEDWATFEARFQVPPWSREQAANTPPELAPGKVWARFRLDYGENVGPTGPARFGEVEDYLVQQPVVLPDFGDAPDSYGTRLSSNGAYHLCSALEWLGQRDRPQAISVSPEFDAVDPGDSDGEPNLHDGLADLDQYDDGVVFLPHAFLNPPPGMPPGRMVEITVRVSDGDSPRYRRDDDQDGNDDEDPPDGIDNDGDGLVDEDPPSPTIWVNGWIDWDDNGVWDLPGEHVVSIQVWKAWDAVMKEWRWEVVLPAFVMDRDDDWVKIGVWFPVFPLPTRELWARFRLDYGENVGPTGPALFGEVEDYLISPDFGDAADPPYATLGASDGPYSINTHWVWLGAGVSPEFDANDPFDTDLVPNIDMGPPPAPDMDLHDDGVRFFPETYIAGRGPGKVWFTVRVQDGDSPRFRRKPVARDDDGDGRADEDSPDGIDNDGDGLVDEDPPLHTIYVNGWIDWDTNGNWGGPMEHVVPGAQIWKEWDPAANRWEWAFAGDNVTRIVDQGEDWVTLEAQFPVPGVAGRELWAWFQVDYDQNGTRNGDEDWRVWYGEVEDYLIAPDFGDAPDPPYKTLAANDGPYHLNSQLEWLGQPGPAVSPEFDANDPFDTDGMPNIVPKPDQDGADDGVVFNLPAFMGAPGWKVAITVRVNLTAFNAGRYGPPPNNNKSIYLNGWIDWNGDGDWDDPGEHVVNVKIFKNPAGNLLAVNLLPAPNLLVRQNAPGNWIQVFMDFPVPVDFPQPLWARFRVDYGENCGAVVNPWKPGPPLANPDPNIPVHFGEVEDYLIAPDFGDAPDPPYPTTRANGGAWHAGCGLEWLGKPGRPPRQGVSPELDATDPADPDGQPNLRGGNADLDRFDDGVIFFPLSYIPTQNGTVRFTVRVRDGDSPRYRRDDDRDGQDDEDPVNGLDDDGDGKTDEDPPSPTIYVNGWIDWNTDGDWNDANEHVVPGAQIWKRWNRATNRWEWTYLGGNTANIVDQGNDWVTFEAQFPVPPIGPGDLWARFRLDYGENVGPTGKALFGEVEDYFIGADFGDAPDPPYPTLSENNGARHLDIHYEWIDSVAAPAGGLQVSREPDACLAPRPPATGDQDNARAGQPPNLGFRPGCADEDKDLLDNAAAALVFAPVPGIRLSFRVHSTISAHGYDIMGQDDDGDGRIDEDPVDRQDNDGDGQVDEDGPDPVILMSLSPVAPQPALFGALLSTPPWSGGKGRYQSVDADDDRDGRLNEDPPDGVDNDGDGLVDEDPPIRKPLIINVFIDWNADGDWDDPGEWVVRDREIAPETFGKDGQYTLGEPFIDQNGDGVWQPGEPFTDVAGQDSQDYNWFFPAPGPLPTEGTIWVRIRLSYAELSDGTVPMGALPPGAPFGIIPAQDLEKLGIAHASELGANLPQAAGPRGGMYFGEVEDYPVVRIVKAASVYEAAPETEFDYTITFSNPGSRELSDVELFDPIPAELEFVSLTQAPADVYYDSERDALVGTFDVPPESETRITYRVRVRTTVSEGAAIRNCPRLTYDGYEVEFCSEEVLVVPAGPTQFYATVTVDAGEGVTLRPDRLNPNFWSYISQGREVEPVTTFTICIPFVGCMTQVSGGIEGVTFRAAEPGERFPDWTTTGLPPGLKVNEQVGVVSGVPMMPGTFYPAILAIDQATGNVLAILKITLTVQPREITPPPPPPPEENIAPHAEITCTAEWIPDLGYQAWVCHTITFDAEASYDPDGEIVRYDWDFGDGTTAHGPVVSHHFTEPGTYRVCLTVWDDDGAKGRACITLYVELMG